MTVIIMIIMMVMMASLSQERKCQAKVRMARNGGITHPCGGGYHNDHHDHKSQTIKHGDDDDKNPEAYPPHTMMGTMLMVMMRLMTWCR